MPKSPSKKIVVAEPSLMIRALVAKAQIGAGEAAADAEARVAQFVADNQVPELRKMQKADPDLYNVVSALQAWTATDKTPEDIREQLDTFAHRLEVSWQAGREDVYEYACNALQPFTDAGLLPGSVIESLDVLLEDFKKRLLARQKRAAAAEAKSVPETVARKSNRPTALDRLKGAGVKVTEAADGSAITLHLAGHDVKYYVKTARWETIGFQFGLVGRGVPQLLQHLAEHEKRSRRKGG